MSPRQGSAGPLGLHLDAALRSRPPGNGGGTGVVIVGAGPVGCTSALLLADFGIPVVLLERRPVAHPLPRAVHLDDEVVRILYRIGVGDGFLARSRPGGGLRLLDAQHRVMAEFSRGPRSGRHGFPQANMFHQPDLEELLLARVAEHPLIDLCRGMEVIGLAGVHDPISSTPVRVRVRPVGGPDDADVAVEAQLVLGSDGANSTVRDLIGITMNDLGFTERWLVVDIRTSESLDTWDGVEQICDPARAATFMQVTEHRYRWEFALHEGEEEADLITPQSLGRLLLPWTGRQGLDGMEIIRSASYTFRARIASRFRAGRVFLLGDAAHLTPPFVGQGLAAGLRDADNLAWKIAHVLNGRATDQLLSSYESERRPHATAMVKKAVLIGWAMTGGQGRAADVRRTALALLCRSPRLRRLIADPATPALKAGALQERPHWWPGPRGPRIGGLISNPLVYADGGVPVRLDDVAAGRVAVLTARRPEAALVDAHRRYGLALIRVRNGLAARTEDGPAPEWREVQLATSGSAGDLDLLVHNPQLAVLVRPDRVVAAVEPRSAVPRLPWTVTGADGPPPSTGDADHLSRAF